MDEEDGYDMDVRSKFHFFYNVTFITFPTGNYGRANLNRSGADLVNQSGRRFRTVNCPFLQSLKISKYRSRLSHIR